MMALYVVFPETSSRSKYLRQKCQFTRELPSYCLQFCSNYSCQHEIHKYTSSNPLLKKYRSLSGDKVEGFLIPGFLLYSAPGVKKSFDHCDFENFSQITSTPCWNVFRKSPNSKIVFPLAKMLLLWGVRLRFSYNTVLTRFSSSMLFWILLNADSRSRDNICPVQFLEVSLNSLRPFQEMGLHERELFQGEAGVE